MSNAAQSARKAALALAAHTREEDLNDNQFEAALSNCAYYYGIDVPSARIAFDGLTADEFLGAAAPTTAMRVAPWA